MKYDQYTKYLILAPVLAVLMLFLPFVSILNLMSFSFISASFNSTPGTGNFFTSIILLLFIACNGAALWFLLKKQIGTARVSAAGAIVLILLYAIVFWFALRDYNAQMPVASIRWIWVLAIILVEASIFAIPEETAGLPGKPASTAGSNIGDTIKGLLKNVQTTSKPNNPDSRPDVKIPEVKPGSIEDAENEKSIGQERDDKQSDAKGAEVSETPADDFGFEGQIESLTGEDKGMVLPLKAKVKIFLNENDGSVILSPKEEAAFGELYYIPEYQEYALKLSETGKVSLESGQLLGTRGIFYLPRGTKIQVTDQIYLLQ